MLSKNVWKVIGLFGVVLTIIIFVGVNVIKETNSENVMTAPNEVVAESNKLQLEINDDIKATNNKVIVEGTTNLLDDTTLSYSIVGVENEDEDKILGEVVVKDGAFNAEEDISGFEAGEIEVMLIFSTITQPEHLKEIYGKNGENIESDDFLSDGTLSYAYTFEKKAPIILEGTGNKATEKFELEDYGFAIFDTKHDGESNFALKLLDSDGKQLDLLVNTVGQYEGKTLALIPSAGEYLLNVTADGSWKIEVTQSLPPEIPDSPTVLKGSGDDVVFVNLNSGLNIFTSKHNGESNFAVKIDGRLLVNEIGTYDGSIAEQISEDGSYIISVTADGEWSIEIE